MSKSTVAAEKIKAMILSGQCPEGSPLPPERELAAVFGMSQGTVTKGISILSGEGYVRKVHGSGNYVAARKPNRPQAICFLIDGLGEKTNQIWHVVYEHFYLMSLGSGIKVELKIEPQGQPLTALTGFEDSDLIVAATAQDTAMAEHLRGFKRPVLWLDEYAEPLPGPVIACDNFMAGRLVAEHFLALGCRRLAYLTHWFGQGRYAPSDRRFDGFLAAVRDAHLPDSTVTLVTCRAELPAFRQSMKVELAGIDGFFCFDDTIATLITAFLAPERRPAADFALAAVDDSPLARSVTPPLTSVRQPCEALGKSAWRSAERLLKHQTIAEMVRVPPELMVRASSASFRPQVPAS